MQRALPRGTKKQSVGSIANHPWMLGIRKLPTWLLVVLLISAAAGAGAGTVITSGVTGTAPTAVEQGVVVGEPTASAEGSGFANDHSFTSVNKDGTRFTAAVEVNVGDKFKIQIPVSNKSDADAVVELFMELPGAITVEVDRDGSDDSDATGIGNVMRTSMRTWKMDLAASSSGDNLEITVAHADDEPPGFYTIAADLKQVDY